MGPCVVEFREWFQDLKRGFILQLTRFYHEFDDETSTAFALRA